MPTKRGYSQIHSSSPSSSDASRKKRRLNPTGLNLTDYGIQSDVDHPGNLNNQLISALPRGDFHLPYITNGHCHWMGASDDKTGRCFAMSSLPSNFKKETTPRLLTYWVSIALIVYKEWLMTGHVMAQTQKYMSNVKEDYEHARRLLYFSVKRLGLQRHSYNMLDLCEDTKGFPKMAYVTADMYGLHLVVFRRVPSRVPRPRECGPESVTDTLEVIGEAGPRDALHVYLVRENDGSYYVAEPWRRKNEAAQAAPPDDVDEDLGIPYERVPEEEQEPLGTEIGEAERDVGVLAMPPPIVAVGAWTAGNTYTRYLKPGE